MTTKFVMCRGLLLVNTSEPMTATTVRMTTTFVICCGLLLVNTTDNDDNTNDNNDDINDNNICHLLCVAVGQYR